MFKIQSLKSNVKGSINNVVVSFQTAFDKIENKAKGTFAENWVKFWKNVFTDYKEVAIDLGKDVRDRPLKAATLISIAGFVTYLFKCNPNEADYRSAVIRAGNDMRLVHPSLQKKEAANHLRYIEECYNKDLIRRLNLGVASIMWVDKYSKENKSEEALNKYLKVTYGEFFDRILDYGILKRWIILPKKMEDYDVNF